MNENVKKFFVFAEKNEELKAKLAALTDKETAAEKAAAIAKEYGFDLKPEDFQPKGDVDLSDEELTRVAGGGECGIISAMGHHWRKCGCVAAGIGQ